MRLIFGFLFLIAYLVRGAVRWGLNGGAGSHSVFRKCSEIFQRLANHSFGELYQAGRRRLIYQTADRELEVQVTCQSICRMKIRVNRSFPFSATFVRLPRLIYSFAEAFLGPNQRLEDSGYILHTSAQTAAELRLKPGLASIMKQLGEFGVSVKFDKHCAVVWKPVRREDLTEESFTRLFGLLKDLADVCTKAPFDIPIQPLNSEKRCAYCKEQVNGEESLRYCTHCGTPHHTDCFELNGGCTTYGCSEVVQKQRYDQTLQA